jgi:hypothetical protein
MAQARKILRGNLPLVLESRQLFPEELHQVFY